MRHARGGRVLAAAAALGSLRHRDHRMARRRRRGHGAGSCEPRVDSARLPWGIAVATCRRLRRCVRVAHAALAPRARRPPGSSRSSSRSVVPAAAMYPSLFFFATEAKERLIATTYAPQVTSQRKDLQDRLYQALEQIDSLPGLADFVSGASTATPTIDRAFAVWSNTALATYRLTSSVELYSSDGGLMSRFALLPGVRDAAVMKPRAVTGRSSKKSCRSAPPSATSRRRAKASARRASFAARSSCASMLDYRTLPFISSAESVSRVAAARRSARVGRLAGQRRRVRLLRMEPRADLRVGHRHLAAARRCVRTRGGVARAVLDDARRVTTNDSACISRAIAAASMPWATRA